MQIVSIYMDCQDGFSWGKKNKKKKISVSVRFAEMVLKVH